MHNFLMLIEGKDNYIIKILHLSLICIIYNFYLSYYCHDVGISAIGKICKNNS